MSLHATCLSFLVAVDVASSLLFNWIAQYMYEGDAPLAERRAAALAPGVKDLRAPDSYPIEISPALESLLVALRPS